MTSRRCQLLLLAVLLAVPSVAHSGLSLLGNAGIFFSRGYQSYYGVTGSLFGEELGLQLHSVILDERLVQYTISNTFLNGNTMGDSEPLHLLEENLYVNFSFLPYRSYTLNSWGGLWLQKVKDGPIRSNNAQNYFWGSQFMLKAEDLPTSVVSWTDSYYRSEDYSSLYRERQKRLSILSYYDVPKTRLELSYDFSNNADLESRSMRVAQSLIANSYTTFATRTTLHMIARGIWNRNDFANGRHVSSRNIGLGGDSLYKINDKQEITGLYSFNESRAYRTYILSNRVSGLWYYRYTDFWRIVAGGDFAHEATDGVAEGFVYQKGTEALQAGSDGYFGGAGWRFEPSYLFRIGVIQVQDGVGGMSLGHNLGIPLMISYIRQLPMSLSFSLVADSDSSSFPRESVSRNGQYRISTREMGSYTLSNLLYVEGFYDRTDRREGRVDAPWQRTESWELSAGGWLRVEKFRSRLSMRLSNRWQWIANNTFDMIQNATLDMHSQVHRTVGIDNGLELTRYEYSGGQTQKWLRYKLDILWRVRAIEVIANLHYDTLPYADSRPDPWQLFLRIRRYFGYRRG